MKLSIVIINWNSGEQLSQCVQSILLSKIDFNYEIIIVDNGSHDGSHRELPASKLIHLIENGSNLGFAKACNIGANIASGEYLLFLNPDTRVFRDTLEDSIGYVDADTDLKNAIWGIQLVDDTGNVSPTCSRFPSLSRIVSKSIGLNKFFPKTSMNMSDWNHSESRTVDQIMGAFFIIRRKIFENMDGFDEQFFVYFEEVDLSYRLHLEGFKSYYIAHIKAFHKGGGVSGQVRDHRLFYSLRSRILYAKKHFGVVSVIIICAFTVLLEPLARIVQQLSKRDGAAVLQTCSAYKMLISWLVRNA